MPENLDFNQKNTTVSRAHKINSEIVNVGAWELAWPIKTDQLVEIWNRNPQRFSPINLATFLDRYSKALPPHQQTPTHHQAALSEIDMAVKSAAPFFDQQGQVGVACCYARLKRAPTETISQLALNAFKGARSYNLQALSNLVWAHGYLQSSPEDFYEKALLVAEPMKPQFEASPIELSKISWGLACASPDLARRFVKLFDDKLETITFNTIALVSMHHVGLACKISYPDAMMQKIHNALANFSPSAIPENEYVKQIGQALTQMNLAFETKVALEGYRTKFLVKYAETRIALEIDGQAYISLSASSINALTGSDALRERVLENCGYRICRISDQEWNEATDKPTWLFTRLLQAARRPV